ncbi:hypothetical protein EW093_17110 (plasmid) [Thiospirochaeta perfilievii]|uniref:AAA domain-containing protein n=1 Tax=Thiospirochaeta perfilievii TaxID=252967 RepID=A0A5C1QG67_9SPIO|nr:AAA family ATPase [Thiospirochaeta perfilievii]QEN06427.1 hypothetical protein EW093_17110 [Thiospirochaeta perfilievii]
MGLVNVKDASAYTGLAETTIRKYISEGRVNAQIEESSNTYLLDKREIMLQVPSVLCVFNQKGGPGKTSTSITLADYYEKKGYTTLVVDLDPQMNTSKTFFDYQTLAESKSLYNFFEDNTPVNKLVLKYNDYIDVIPSSLKLMTKKRDYDIDDLDKFVKSFYSTFKKYNVVILDCCPDVNSLSKFGLLSANHVIIPFVPEPFNYDGVKDAIGTVNQVKKYSEYFKSLKVLINAHEQRSIRIQEEYITMAKDELKDYLVEGSIPNFVGIKERPLTDNLFNQYTSSNNAIEKILAVFDAIDKSIYEGA